MMFREIIAVYFEKHTEAVSTLCGQNADTAKAAILRVNVKHIFSVRFQVLTEESMKIKVFWGVGPCSLVGVDRRFRGAYCFHHRPDGDNTHL
jgi:hypothetical protein